MILANVRLAKLLVLFSIYGYTNCFDNITTVGNVTATFTTGFPVVPTLNTTIPPAVGNVTFTSIAGNQTSPSPVIPTTPKTEYHNQTYSPDEYGVVKLPCFYYQSNTTGRITIARKHFLSQHKMIMIEKNPNCTNRPAFPPNTLDSSTVYPAMILNIKATDNLKTEEAMFVVHPTDERFVAGNTSISLHQWVDQSGVMVFYANSTQKYLHALIETQSNTTYQFPVNASLEETIMVMEYVVVFSAYYYFTESEMSYAAQQDRIRNSLSYFQSAGITTSLYCPSWRLFVPADLCPTRGQFPTSFVVCPSGGLRVLSRSNVSQINCQTFPQAIYNFNQLYPTTTYSPTTYRPRTTYRWSYNPVTPYNYHSIYGYDNSWYYGWRLAVLIVALIGCIFSLIVLIARCCVIRRNRQRAIESARLAQQVAVGQSAYAPAQPRVFGAAPVSTSETILPKDLPPSYDATVQRTVVEAPTPTGNNYAKLLEED